MYRSWRHALEKRGLTIDKETYLEETGKSGIDMVNAVLQRQVGVILILLILLAFLRHYTRNS